MGRKAGIDSMAETEAATIGQHFYDETVQRRLSEDVFAPDVVFHNYFLARSELRGIDQVRAAFDVVYSAIPDTQVSIQDILADRDKIVVHHTHHGTFTAPLLSLPPNGQPIEFEGIEIFRIEDGKIAEIWNFDDNATALRQLGLLEGSGEYKQVLGILAERARARAAG